MSTTLFVSKIGFDELRIEVSHRIDKPFTLECNLDRRGSSVYLELPRRYQTVRGAKSAAARIVGSGLEWKTPDPLVHPSTLNPDLEMAAQRDASWLNYPDTRTPKRYHIVIDSKPACGAQMLMQDPELADTVPVSSRCQRPGCKSRWP